MRDKAKCVIMTFGLGGNMGEYRYLERNSGYSSSWYIEPQELQRYIDNGHYPAEEMEGCILVDKRAALEKDPMLTLAAPLIDAGLEGKQHRPFDKQYLEDPLNRAIVDEIRRAGYSHVVMSGFIGGLDKVSPELYLEWWTARGARSGEVKNGEVIWHG